MRKYLALFLAILCTLMLLACKKQESEGPPYTFIGEVTEIYDSEGTFLLKVTDYRNCKFNAQEVIIHETTACPAYAVGDYFLIALSSPSGPFLETDPPQLRNAIVAKTDAEGNILESAQLEEHSFEATVLEVHDTFLLVEPAEGTWERTSADKIEVSLKDKTSWPIPQVGDTVNVFYNGEIMETYPARVGQVYRVEIVI